VERVSKITQKAFEPRKRHGFNGWVGKIPGGGHGNPHHYSCLEKAHDRGAWQATGHRVTESDTTKVTEHARQGHLGYFELFIYALCDLTL